MAKKWKADRVYKLVDREGFANADDCGLNKKLASILEDKCFEPELITEDGRLSFIWFCDSGFCQAGDRVELPYFITQAERKYFKRIK